MYLTLLNPFQSSAVLVCPSHALQFPSFMTDSLSEMVEFRFDFAAIVLSEMVVRKERPLEGGGIPSWNFCTRLDPRAGTAIFLEYATFLLRSILACRLCWLCCLHA